MNVWKAEQAPSVFEDEAICGWHLNCGNENCVANCLRDVLSRSARKITIVVKPVKYFLKQAAKAEVAAQQERDEEVSESLLAMARGYRSQAEILKSKQRQDKKSKHCG